MLLAYSTKCNAVHKLMDILFVREDSSAVNHVVFETCLHW